MTLAEYEAMSDAERTHLIGEKVMGWKHVSWHGQYQWDAGGTVGGFPACTDFHPFTSDADACAVLDRIVDLGWDWVVSHFSDCGEGVLATFIKGDASANATGHTRPAAICLAALRAVGAVE